MDPMAVVHRPLRIITGRRSVISLHLDTWHLRSWFTDPSFYAPDFAVILQLRIYAMYGRSKKIGALLCLSFLLTNIASFSIAFREFIFGKGENCITATPRNLSPELYSLTYSVTSAPFPGLPIHFCLSKGATASTFSFAFWIPYLAFETLLFGLALYKGFASLRSHASKDWVGKQGMDILVKDSIFYFSMCVLFQVLPIIYLYLLGVVFSVFLIYLTNELVWIFGGV